MSEPGIERLVVVVGEDATEQLGVILGGHLAAGDTLALIGDLGAGKTCLVRGVARGMRLDEPEEVCSPTYLLVVEHPGPIPLLHVDAYLPDKTRGFLQDGGLDYLSEFAGVVAVEWADRIADLLPATSLRVELRPDTVDGQEARRVRLTGCADRHGWLNELPPRI